MFELRDVLFHVLRLAGPRGVNRTMLVKLAYFSELEYWRRYASPLTGTPFRLLHYGAWAPEVIFVAEQESDHIEHSYFASWPFWQHNYKLRDDRLSELPVEIEQLLMEIVERYAGKTAAEVGALSKETEPMVDAIQGVRLDLSVVAPHRPKLVVRNDRLAHAQRSLDLSQRGSRAELDARDTAELSAWAPARDRAAAAQNASSSS